MNKYTVEPSGTTIFTKGGIARGMRRDEPVGGHVVGPNDATVAGPLSVDAVMGCRCRLICRKLNPQRKGHLHVHGTPNPSPIVDRAKYFRCYRRPRGSLRQSVTRRADGPGTQGVRCSRFAEFDRSFGPCDFPHCSSLSFVSHSIHSDDRGLRVNPVPATAQRGQNGGAR